MCVCACACVCVCVSQGGTRVRTIMHSPNFFKNETRTYDGLVHITDLLPTLYALGMEKPLTFLVNLDTERSDSVFPMVIEK